MLILVGDLASWVVEGRVQTVRGPLRKTVLSEVRDESNLLTRRLARHPSVHSHTRWTRKLLRILAIVGPEDRFIGSDRTSSDQNGQKLARPSRKAHHLLSQLGVHMERA